MVVATASELRDLESHTRGAPENVGDWDPSGRSVPRSVAERMERYGNGDLDLDFQQIAVTAADVR
jgi:hypothetical protein